jgi:hypothetical protein
LTDRFFTEYGIFLNADSFPIVLKQSSFEKQGKFPGEMHFCISILSFFSRKLPDFPGIFLDQNLFGFFFKFRKVSHVLRKF